jgi:hypothetical protein
MAEEWDRDGEGRVGWGEMGRMGDGRVLGEGGGGRGRRGEGEGEEGGGGRGRKGEGGGGGGGGEEEGGGGRGRRGEGKREGSYRKFSMPDDLTGIISHQFHKHHSHVIQIIIRVGADN